MHGRRCSGEDQEPSAEGCDCEGEPVAAGEVSHLPGDEEAAGGSKPAGQSDGGRWRRSQSQSGQTDHDRKDPTQHDPCDGHGEFGHKVSWFLRTAFPKALFAEPSFATDVPTALREAVRKAEAAMLKSNYQVRRPAPPESN